MGLFFNNTDTTLHNFFAKVVLLTRSSAKSWSASRKMSPSAHLVPSASHCVTPHSLPACVCGVVWASPTSATLHPLCPPTPRQVESRLSIAYHIVPINPLAVFGVWLVHRNRPAETPALFE